MGSRRNTRFTPGKVAIKGHKHGRAKLKPQGHAFKQVTARRVRRVDLQLAEKVSLLH